MYKLEINRKEHESITVHSTNKQTLLDLAHEFVIDNSMDVKENVFLTSSKTVWIKDGTRIELNFTINLNF